MLREHLGVPELLVNLPGDYDSCLHPADPSGIVVLESIRGLSGNGIVVEITSVHILVVPH